MTHRDTSQLNPDAAGRRRLLKALGLGAIATQISLDWSRPALRFGALPAHAQATNAEGCVVDFELTVDYDALFTIQPFHEDSNGATEFASFVGEDGVFTTAYTYLQPPNQTQSLGFSYTFNDSSYVADYTAAASCCVSATASDFEQIAGTFSRHLFAEEIVTGDSGTCSFEEAAPTPI